MNDAMNGGRSPREPAAGASARLVPAAGEGPTDLLGEPSLGRQWMVRRLQRALVLERWGGPFRRGVARRLRGPMRQPVEAFADAAGRRALALTALIEDLRSAPYGSVGLAGPVAAALGSCLAVLSRRWALAAVRRLAALTLAEYDHLEALAAEAAGVPRGLPAALHGLRQTAEREVEALRD